MDLEVDLLAVADMAGVVVHNAIVVHKQVAVLLVLLDPLVNLVPPVKMEHQVLQVNKEQMEFH